MPPEPRSRPSLARILGLAFAAVLVGCGGGGGSDGGGSGGGGTVTLFSDSFDGAFPGSAWSVRAGTATVIGSAGMPAPSLDVGTNGTFVEYVGTPFSAGSPFTVFAMVRASFEPAAGSIQPAAFLRITDANIGTVFAPLSLADVTLTTAPASAPGTLRATYRIMTTTLGSVSSTEVFAGDGAFHDFAFRRAADGRGLWLRNGVQKLSTGASLFHTTSGEVRLAFESENAGLADSGFQADEVLVQRP
jgi:hypothetical protein